MPKRFLAPFKHDPNPFKGILGYSEPEAIKEEVMRDEKIYIEGLYQEVDYEFSSIPGLEVTYGWFGVQWDEVIAYFMHEIYPRLSTHDKDIALAPVLETHDRPLYLKELRAFCRDLKRYLTGWHQCEFCCLWFHLDEMKDGLCEECRKEV